MITHRSDALVLLALILLTVAGAALAPLATTPAGSVSMDADFIEYMEPRLMVLLDSARQVEGMVGERSRNVLALRAESERIAALVEQIDSYLAGRDLSPSEERVADLYREGATNLERAIDSAFEALSSFDFSARPEMIPVFTEGTQLIEEALSSLRTEVGSGSSYTVVSAARSGGA